MEGSGALRISHFRVETQLKRDELGYFFKAIDEQLDRLVVLRVVRAGQLEHAGAIGPMRVRIRANAKAAAHVSHPNLVTIYEFRSLSETDMVVMEHVEGDTLDELRTAGRRWTVVEVARMLARLADALSTAHEAGLVHGNVNAANVRIKSDGRFKLLDLGVPKIDTVEDRVPHDPSDDVRGLANIARDLLGPPVDTMTDTVNRQDPLADAGAARAIFGFLAPVLIFALRDDTGYRDGAAFRDAIFQAMEMTTGRNASASEFERGFSTHLVGPDKRMAGEDNLPIDGRALQPLAQAGKRSGPRLVLPADLAERAPHDSDDNIDFRLAPRPAPWPKRLLALAGPGVMITAIMFIAISIAAVLIVRRTSSAETVANPGGSDEIALAQADSTSTALVVGSEEVRDPPADDAQAVQTSTDAGASAASSSGAPSFSAFVRVSPAGSTIRALNGGGTWQDAVELSVASGDSIRVELSHPGYVSQRQTFRGSRIAVALAPDSVLARFQANQRADVFFVTAAGERRLGTTDLTVRLPSGRHRIVYRAAGQPEWDEVHDMSRAGVTYDVTKTDYVTIGSLIASVSPTWARISIDGGPPKETPATFESLSVGRHVVTVNREGFSTIVDTVVVGAGEVTRRQYTLRR